MRLLRCFLLLIIFTLTAQSTYSQLSDLHYLPPLKQGRNNQGIRDQAIYLSTPSTTDITVNVYQGTNNTPVQTFVFNNLNPVEWTLTNGDNNIILVNDNNTGVVLTNSGLRFESGSTDDEFYVNYRGHSQSQAASLTAKGREAIGRNFKWGGVPNLGSHNTKSNTLGIMATEDNTTVILSGYDPDITFRQGGNEDGITADTYTINLDANESFVFENYVGTRNFPSHIDGWIGASIVSDKDIVISNGSINFGRQAGSGNRDAGIDQPVPENRLGKEYVFIRGNGNTNGSTEFPLLIATADNTSIYLNGSTVPVATIDNGEYYQVPSSYYSSNTVGANMFVQTTKDVYAYQCMAGASAVYTQGLNFVAPVNCLLPDVMDNIPDIRNIGGTTVTGGLTIIAAVNTPDANVQVFQDGVEITKPASSPVAGTTDWKTFFIPNLDGDISVQSTGPMAVGFFGYNGAQGVAGYFSGFDTVPEVILEINGGVAGDCFAGSSLFEATANFDAYQWYYDGVIIPGANTQFYAATVAGDYFVRGTKGPCTYDSDALNIFYCDPDVVVNKSVDRAEITEGETATFTIRVENLGFDPITNLQLTDNIPAGLTLINSHTVTGTWNGTVWDIGTLNAGVPVFLELEVRGDEIDILPFVRATNTVSHTQDQVDENITEDILSATITVHNDFDNDGVIDVVDLDDDNDGIYDADECGASFCIESIINESFEEPTISGSSIQNESAIPGWSTTASDQQIEIWQSGFLGVDSYDGTQHAELNANQNGALYQSLCLTPGTVMNWSARHRGRDGDDTMQVRIGPDLASATIEQTMTTGNTTWVEYSGTYTVPAGQNNTVFIFEAVSSAGGISSGNFIDDVKIDVVVPILCDDSDNDGFPDNLDLDSDNDGCSDANEFYSDNNADGGDGGEFGTGVPVVDSTDGTVTSASYVQVVVPFIELQNTSEDLGGTDINGQDVNLGDIFNYVLRFQNTGSDNATSYTIRDVLPANVTVNNIDVTGAPGVVPNHDLVTNIITFQVPDDLVEVGDPQYTIVIEVELSGNCSDFVAACSETLENYAYSTYTGETNTTTFSDEPGSTIEPVCATTGPQAATNNLLNDLLSCNVARTVQLCGNDAILTAGAGFTTYTWALDTNGNGQIDVSETPINDGDPDGDPSTLLVTDIGDYIVEKSGATGCSDRTELITVERFGTTQTNPIIDYFNQVNSDVNTDNDIKGEIVICSNDGSELPQIFLCGDTDEATIQLGITDADSIEWQQLDETSCADAGDDCANTDDSCTWNSVGTGDNYTATDSGRFRVVIRYLNGCFSNFYFNVFKNTLDIDYVSSDIFCSTPGNIRITNVGTGYGFQLVNDATNAIEVPFSANNGPNFDITTNGTYRVEITQLNPVTGDPIDGACIFETEAIGIQERDYQVTVGATPADCSGFGTIDIQALNVLPNYNYELRIDDGSNGGLGTFFQDHVASSDNTHSFNSVPAGEYIVITTTDDGCTDTQNVEVIQIPALDLVASVTDDITCNAGLITLTPDGGDPDPNYFMGIWSIDGVDQFTSIADAQAVSGTFQTTNDFLFPNSSDAGDYVFIVFDSNGCHTLSNSVTLNDLGTVSISAAHTDIICADSSTSTLTITATGGTAPYEYSLDGGTNYQGTNTFTNLPAGNYEITVRDSSGTPTSRCIETLGYEITQPFRLTASAAIIEDASCDPSGALVKILNANGGQAPYTYSFDGGSNFSAIDERRLATGTYQLVIEDDLGCRFSMELSVPNPPTDPTLSTSVDYDCIGEGTITVSTSNTTDFDYTYSLDGTPNIPADNNVFTNITDDTYTVTVEFSSSITPDQSTIFFEDFGTGISTQVGEAGTLYCFEPQDGSTTSCNRGPSGILVNGEYTVTNLVTNPYVFWRSPQDHTGLVDGRFFAIDISSFSTSGVPQPNNILWTRRDLEVLANEEITLNFWAYNLMSDAQTDPDYVNPEILIEILDNTGAIIHSEIAPEIPKNTSDTDWYQRTITFDPGANTDIDVVFRTNRNDDLGNDLILDDITASQIPPVCPSSQDLSVVVADNQAFEAQLLAENDPSCNGVSDGSIRFEVSNFDVVAGFEYSLDGGTNWIAETTSPFTTPANLGDGNYTVMVRRANETSCAVDFAATLTEPSAITPTASITTAISCNTGATITAGATDGTPTYEYQLEDTVGGVISAYQTNTDFTNVSDGSYIVRVRDANMCEQTTSQIDIVPVNPVTFNLTPTACYSGANDATIQVDVTDGNGGYQFRIDGGPWLTPIPASATTYTFTGLANGNYDIEVRDQFGCPPVSNLQSITIEPQLVVDIDVTELSACNDGLITVNATGGNGTLQYAIVPANTSPTGLFTATNTLTVTDVMATANPAGYDVYVHDNNNAPATCTSLTEDIILTPVTALSVTPVPTDPQCFDGLGHIDITVGGGTGPYNYTLTDLSPADGIDYGRSNSNVSTTTLTFNGIGVGDYQVTITDTFGCSVTSTTVTINNAVEITADIVPILPAVCNDPDPLEYGFEFDNVVTPTGTVEYSANGGTSWQTSNELRGYASGSEVFPSIRVEVAPGVYCQRDFDRYIIPFPLDDLDITLSAIVVGCNDLQVTVEGSQGDGSSGYDYTYTDDPANFSTFITDPNVWVNNVPSGTAHTFANIDPTTPQYPEVPLLVPGRTYVFYVRDGAGCIRQSNVNVNDIPGIGLPIEITEDVTPSCDGAANGIITFNLNPDTAYPNMRWEIYELGNTTPIEVSGGGATATNVAYNNTITTTVPLAEGEYYIDVIQVDGSNLDACRGASENVYVPELAPLNATAVVTRDISCNLPGLISINGISGGGGAPFTYDVSGPAGFTTLTGTTDNPVEIPVNSPAGNYTVTLYDQYSCPLVLNTVALTLSPNPTLAVSQDNCSAPITVTAVGTSAAGNFRYAMVPFGNPAPTTFDNNGGIFTNVAAGSYDVYVIDGNGCTAVESNYIVNPVLSANATLTKPLDCTASPEATINIDITDGSGSYEYSITNTAGAPAVVQGPVPSNNFDYNAPLAGDYTVTIYDTTTPNSVTCNREFVITVPSRSEPNINIDSFTNVTCSGNDDGIINVSANPDNGIGPYTFTIISGPGSSATFPIAATSSTSATASFENLEGTIAGITYTIRVTAANGCTQDITQDITEPEVVDNVNVTVAQFTCTSGNTQNNASISIDLASITGGSGNYTRFEFINTITSTTVQDSNSPVYIETDFNGGNYEIFAYDDTGCSNVLATMAIINPYDQIISASITIDDPISCTSTGEDISIEVTGSITDTSTPVGLANYEFRQLPSTTYEPVGDNTFNDLTPGTYTFGARNINTGCEIFVEHTVAEPNTFDITVDKLADVVCFGDDGQIQFTLSDASYVGTFTYEIFDTNGTTIDTDDVSILGPVATVPLGLTGPIDIPAGEYRILVTQDAFPTCSQERVFTITGPSAAIGLNPVVTSSVSCSNDQGTAEVSPTGGVAPYTITIDNGSGPMTATNVNAHIFQNLSAGTYTVTVTDALGCPINFTNEFTLVQPDDITGTISITDTLECEGDTDAALSFVITPGRNVTPNYNYVLNTYNDIAGTTLLRTSTIQTIPDFDNLGAGFYSVTVTDAIGCDFETTIVEIVEPPAVEALLVVDQQITCSTGADLLLVASGGTGPYTWSETANGTFSAMNNSGGADTHLFSNIPAGNYSYFIRDNEGCTSIVSNEIIITEPEELMLQIDDSAAIVNCTGESTAVIIADATGGFGDYEYALATDDLFTLASTIETNQDGIFTDLPDGSYYVRVQSRDCEDISNVINIVDPTPLVVVPNITEISCSDAEDGSITLDVTGGTGDYQFAISPNLDQFDDENTFDELGPGDYIVIAQDANGCFEVVEFSLIAPAELTASSTVTDEICFESADGTVTLEINGGTAPYSTALNSNADADFVQDLVQYTDLPSGTHVVFVRDANGCETTEVFEVDPGVNLAGEAVVEYLCDTDITTNRVSIAFEDQSIINDVLYGLDTSDPAEMVLDGTFEGISGGDHFITVLHSNGCPETYEFTITEFEPLQLQLTESAINTISALAIGGSGTYTFTINGESPQSETEFYILETDTYTITVTDENGCSVSDDIFIEFIDIEIPNFFTPDGDGINDTWAPRNMEPYENIFIKIYDRYGRTLYVFEGNQDDWDGRYQLKSLPTGDYWYIIKLNGIEDQREFIGNFTLYR